MFSVAAVLHCSWLLVLLFPRSLESLGFFNGFCFSLLLVLLILLLFCRSLVILFLLSPGSVDSSRFTCSLSTRGSADFACSHGSPIVVLMVLIPQVLLANLFS